MDDARRCTATNRRGERCGKWAIRGGTVCLAHGGAAGQVRDAAARRVQEQRAMEVAQRTVPRMDLSRYSDPVRALEFAVSYSHALAERLAGLVEQIPDRELACRGEVVAAMKALADLRAAAVDSLRIGLDA
jgi:hypothetical protein